MGRTQNKTVKSPKSKVDSLHHWWGSQDPDRRGTCPVLPCAPEGAARVWPPHMPPCTSLFLLCSLACSLSYAWRQQVVAGHRAFLKEYGMCA